MLIEVANKRFTDRKQAVTTLAFCHYPVTVTITNDNGETDTATFDSFDKARVWVEEQKD